MRTISNQVISDNKLEEVPDFLHRFPHLLGFHADDNHLTVCSSPSSYIYIHIVIVIYIYIHM